ncbi:MAG: Holliday junction branch migration protein RuvA, partial [Clostridia bacterium]|nr:Holliday junction branch migration protein RuvA [Clostridia bacterium]
QEKAMFLKLISVSGVGPKVGISVLSQMSVNDVALAVATGDVKALSRVKGMGKKTAEKIIVELRDRVIAPVGGASAADSSPIVHMASGDEDAVVALISLGFTRAESERAVSRAKQQGAKTVEDIIMLALKGM